jgi:hypothetical protein
MTKKSTTRLIALSLGVFLIINTFELVEKISESGLSKPSTILLLIGCCCLVLAIIILLVKSTRLDEDKTGKIGE